MAVKTQTLQLFALLAAASLLAASPAPAADQSQQGQGQAVVTILNGNEIPGGISQDALHLKVGGKDTQITGWTALQSPASPIEVVVLIDNDARGSLGTQMSDISKFIRGLRPDAKAAVAYMENGRAVLAGPFTADHAAAANELHLPTHSGPAVSASPYFCLSDLARNWPSTDAHARREVVMVTDGVDPYERRYDPQDPYVAVSIEDSIRARLIVYSIYWRNQGSFDQTAYAADDGQNLLTQLSEATGGNNYWVGFGNPVSFEPYFDDIDKRIHNQYELDFMTPIGSKPQMERLQLKTSAKAKIDAPQQVYVHTGVE
jgi:hypothetical protein